MQKQKTKKPMVIVIDGVIGAGKTTLIKQALIPILSKKGWKVAMVAEPVKSWTDDGLLQNFYQDPKRWAYHFQTKVFHDRVMKSQEKYKKFNHCTDIYLLERSIFSDRLFVEILHDQGNLTDMEYEHYYKWWHMWREVMPFEPDLFVYLKPTLGETMRRIQERARDSENLISQGYQKQLQDKHDEFLSKGVVEISDSHYVPCITLETDSNFRDDPLIQEEIALKLEKHVKDFQSASF